VHRIRLENQEFEGENNAYLREGDGPTTLVDTGVATDQCRAQLEAGIADAGAEIADVEVVVLTHWHSDHAGLAGWVQSASGATIYAHEADVPMIGGRSFVDLDGLHAERLDAWGVPEAEQSNIEETARRTVRMAGDPVEVDPLVEGDELDAGDLTLHVIHTPGHAAGLISLAIEDQDAAFVGDTVLPVYTPNIGGADIRVERPLATYRESLRRLDEAGFDRFYPGHRDPIDDPAGRIAEILAHHVERTDRVIGVLEERGPSTAWEVSAELFGELSGVHILHGPGEAFAHLDELEAEGVVARADTEYRLLADAGSAD
jgi:glyoxylase-like metal-dependent hydrolase (beta-lactamase superfamily II)